MQKINEVVTQLLDAKVNFISRLEEIIIDRLPEQAKHIVLDAIDNDCDALDPTNPILIALLTPNKTARDSILDETASDYYETAARAVDTALEDVLRVIGEGQGNVVTLRPR
jgi:hypothetical protein